MARYSKEVITSRINQLCKEIAYEQQYIDRIEAEPALSSGFRGENEVDAAYWIEGDIWKNVATGFINKLALMYRVGGTWEKDIERPKPIGDKRFDTLNPIKYEIKLRVSEILRQEFPMIEVEHGGREGR